MSSAANDKRGKLEEEFSNRMYDAEASPSQDLWARIDHELTVQENGAYKRSAAFYRQLAAACITLLLLAGGLGTWYFSNPSGKENSLATVAPATNTSPASTPGASPEVAGSSSETAAIAKASGQEGKTVTASAGAEVNPSETIPADPAAIASVSGTTTRTRESAATAGTVVPPADAASMAVKKEATATPYVAETETQQTVAGENPVSLGRSLRQTIAAIAAAEQKPGNTSTMLQQPLAAPGAEARATEDFKELNEQVMAQAKRMEEEQRARLLAFNEESASKQSAKKESSEGTGRWSLGMAYAPGYFEQNIGLPDQGMSSASRLAMDPAATRASSISNSYIEEAREEYAENTDPGFSFGFEVKTGLKLGKKLKLLTGLGFLQNTTRSKSSYLVQQPATFASTGGSGADGPAPIFVPSLSADFAASSMFVVKIPEYKVNHRYRYLTLPVGLQYEGNLGKDWFLYGGAGVAANMLIQSTILASAAEVQNVEYDLNDNSPFRRLQWSGNVSGGVGKRLPGNMSVTVGPEFRSYFNTLLAEPESTQAPQGRPYAVGLNMAVNYDLNAGKKSR